MANLKIYMSDVIKKRQLPFARFVQMMANRLMVGFYRYGPVNRKQDYRKRIDGSLKHYDKTGNKEFLIDAANYCWLEFEAPTRSGTFFEASDSNGKRITIVNTAPPKPWSYQREGD